AGLYVVIGLLAAGLVHVFVSRAFLTRHLGGRGFWPVVKAALVGAPLPLCSCSVLPTAFALRERGAGRGATVSFLISTPETSFDSIAVTWALMGPLMAIVRPVAAVLTALGAGFAEAIRGRHEPEPAPPAPACPHCASDDGEHVETPGRLRRFWQFVVFEMSDEIGPTLALGLLLAGLVAAFVPNDFFTTYLGNRWASMGIMLLVGLPLYVCATASTPLAAAFMLKGLNPGAALVFLLVGPATNLATILTVGKMRCARHRRGRLEREHPHGTRARVPSAVGPDGGRRCARPLPRPRRRPVGLAQVAAAGEGRLLPLTLQRHFARRVSRPAAPRAKKAISCAVGQETHRAILI
ncbi:MAG: permease, partial [Planctomycetota bacterium]|nr:permease [Planctomycetota bacterium]